MADERPLSISAPYAGYCVQCRQPRRVANLQMPSSEHGLPVCANCIQKIANQIETSIQVKVNDVEVGDSTDLELARRRVLEGGV